LAQAHPTLDEVMGLAKEKLVGCGAPTESLFALSQVDDFAVEVEPSKHNARLYAFLLKQFV
jgi:hypothetical protein